MFTKVTVIEEKYDKNDKLIYFLKIQMIMNITLNMKMIKR